MAKRKLCKRQDVANMFAIYWARLYGDRIEQPVMSRFSDLLLINLPAARKGHSKR